MPHSCRQFKKDERIRFLSAPNANFCGRVTGCVCECVCGTTGQTVTLWGTIDIDKHY